MAGLSRRELLLLGLAVAAERGRALPARRHPGMSTVGCSTWRRAMRRSAGPGSRLFRRGLGWRRCRGHSGRRFSG